jgi:hypothetical protein
MCKGSIQAEFVEDARSGEAYHIGISTHGLGVLHPKGRTTAECVACVQGGSTIGLTSIPRALQRQFHVDSTEIATFVVTSNNFQDQLKFGNGRIADLDKFACYGVEVYVVDSATTEDSIDKMAAKSESIEASYRTLPVAEPQLINT